MFKGNLIGALAKQNRDTAADMDLLAKETWKNKNVFINWTKKNPSKDDAGSFDHD